MVYDNTVKDERVSKRTSAESGFSIHQNWNDEADHRHDGTQDEHKYALYSDDGRGNGDYVCGSSDLYWIRRIAYSLDALSAGKFDASGNPKHVLYRVSMPGGVDSRVGLVLREYEHSVVIAPNEPQDHPPVSVRRADVVRFVVNGTDQADPQVCGKCGGTGGFGTTGDQPCPECGGNGVASR